MSRRYGFWRTLGLDPTRDRTEIRRAYGRLLKITSPEDDAAGFQALREAYERALSWAEHSWDDDHEDDDEDQDGETDDLTGAAHPAPDILVELDTPPPPHPTFRRFDEPQPEPTASRGPSEQEMHEANLRRLANLLAGGQRPPETALLEALALVLKAPVMEALATHARTEDALARIVANNFPAADALTAPLIAHFGWSDAAVRSHGYFVSAILARSDDLAALAKLKTPSHHHYAAYQRLSRSPRGRPAWWPRLPNTQDRKVAEVLAAIRHDRPGLIASFDPQVVADWDAYLARPFASPPLMWTLGLVPALGTAIAAAFLPQPKALFALGLYPLLVAFLLLGVLWPRALWRDRFAATASAWAGLGWATLAPLLLLASALAPPNLWSAVPIGLGAGVLMLWAVTTSDIRPEGPVRVHAASLGARGAWFWRGLLTQLVLLAWWLLLVNRLEPGRYMLMSLVQGAVAVAFLFGRQALIRAWASITPARQFKGLIALACLIASAAAWLWAAHSDAGQTPMAVAVVSVAVLGHRVPAAFAQPPVPTFRLYLMWAAALATMATSLHPFDLMLGGVVLLTGAAVITGGAMLRDWTPSWSRRKKRT